MMRSKTVSINVLLPLENGDRFTVNVIRDNGELTWRRSISVYEFTDLEAISRWVRAEVLKALVENRDIWNGI